MRFFCHPAVWAGDGRTRDKFFVRPSLVPPRAGNFRFWMGHQKLLLIVRIPGQPLSVRSPGPGAVAKALLDIFPAL